MTRDIPKRPVLVATAGVVSVSLSWGSVSDGYNTTTSYRIFRGEGSSPSQWKLLAVQSGTTYDDLTVVTRTTYKYFVMGVYADSKSTPWSNIETATPTGLAYLYATRDGGIDVINVIDPLNAFVEAELTIAIGSSSSQRAVADSRYIYIKQISSTVSGLANDTHILDWATGKTTVTLKKTLSTTGLVGTEPNGGDIIVRTGLLSYNNLMFGFDSTGKITSHDITDPENPVLLDTQAVLNGDPQPLSLAFDASTGRLYYTALRVGGSGTVAGYINVASNGMLSASGVEGSVHNSTDYICIGNMLFQSQFWIGNPSGTQIQGRNLNTLLPDVGLLSGGQYYGTAKPLFHNSHLFVPRFNADSGYRAITIYDNSTPYPAPVANFGALNTVATGILISGNTIYFTIGGAATLQMYDITNPAVPVLIDTLSLPHEPKAFAGFPSDGWSTQNGLCLV